MRARRHPHGRHHDDAVICARAVVVSAINGDGHAGSVDRLDAVQLQVVQNEAGRKNGNPCFNDERRSVRFRLWLHCLSN